MENWGDIEKKELKKCNPGEAFEVILSPSTPDAKLDFPLSLLKRKETSMVDIKKKLEAAEESCKSYEAEVLKHLAEKRDYGKDLIQKAIEENCNFSKMMREKLNQQMGAYHENCNAWLIALLEKFKKKNKKLEEVRKDKQTQKRLFL
ncbi:stathmin-like [Limanda limanda]|uniref:stathmin-like n=1 Tax=Limanda limanda TaxID=27771 RepID=UPI0029C835D4|nr:stathmin-like [Limanda limanda]